MCLCSRLTRGAGTQSFSRSLASLLPANCILLNSPVTAISTTPTITSVSTAKAQYTCSHVVISLPTTLYNTIAYSPPLPATKQKLAASIVHGHTSKALLAYSQPWWRHSSSCGLTQSLSGLVAVTRDTSNEAAGHYSLLCFLVGEPGRQWSKESAAERRRLVLQHISSVFGPVAGSVPEPIDYVEQIWSNEEWSAGCPCPAMPPGLMMEADSALRESWGKVHFVGTETAYEWRGYMEGAVRSGLRGAEEVLRPLGEAKL
jgi:monoamine oxidase